MKTIAWMVALGVAVTVMSHMVDDVAASDDDGGMPGVGVVTDQLTGCQYLKSGLGGSITPRVGADYVQVGCRWNDERGADQ